MRGVCRRSAGAGVPDPPLELVGRSATVDGVFGLEIVSGFVESNAIQLRVHRQAVRDVASRSFSRLIASDSLLLWLDSLIGRPFR
jgi:hypothetical protein